MAIDMIKSNTWNKFKIGTTPLNLAISSKVHDKGRYPVYMHFNTVRIFHLFMYFIDQKTFNYKKDALCLYIITQHF